MKKAKSQWKQLTRQILALGLTVVLVSGMTDFSVLAAAAQKQTGIATEKVAENPAADVKTVSGDTVAAEPQSTGVPADGEAGIAVQAEDTTGSDLVEVKVDSVVSNYSTFDEAMEAINKAAKDGNRNFEVKLLKNAEEVTSYWFDSVYGDDAYITLDLNGYNLGSKKKNDVMGTQVSLYFNSGWNVTLKDNGSSSDNKSYMVAYVRDGVWVNSGRYRGIWLNDNSGKGYFNGGSVDSLDLDGTGSVKGGEYNTISVHDRAALNISGGATTVGSLEINNASAKVTLTGGTYGTIWYNTNAADSGDLSNIVKDSYVLRSTNEKTKDEIVDNKGKKCVRYVKVTTFTGDRTAPTWEADDGSDEQYGIQIKDAWYNSMLSTVDFEDHIYNDSELLCTIRAKDTDVKRIYYYTQEIAVSKLADFTPFSSSWLDELRDAGKFTSVETGGKDAITVTLPMEYSNNYAVVLYAYAVDKIGNRSEYICTNGIRIDHENPTIDISEDKTTVNSTEAVVSLTMSEDATLIYFYYDEYTAKNAGYDDITALDAAVKNYMEKGYQDYINGLGTFHPFIKEQDGRWVPAVSDGGKVTITTDNKVEVPLHVAEVKKGENLITLSGLMPYTTTRIIIQAMDKAGNPYVSKNSYFQHVYFRTTQLTPQIEAKPSVTGVYGNKPSELKITGGKVSYDGKEIAGTWEITEDSSTRFQVGTDLECAVTFTPTDTQYGAVAAQVVPTIAKRPITIMAENLEVIYGEDLPQITDDIFTIKEDLAFSDNKSTVTNTLRYVTEAKKGADVGRYEYTLESDSKNYEVTVEYVTGQPYGVLTIEQAQGVIEKTNKFQETKTVTFGDSAFSISDWVTANHTETAISYEVVEAKNRKGRDDTIITVTPEGMVEIHNAGTATIQISLPASTNYKRSESERDLYVKVTVERMPITWGPIVKNYLYTKGGYDEVMVESVLPEGFGSIEDVECNFAQCSVSGKEGFLEKSPSIGYNGGGYPVRIKYTVNPGQIGDNAQINWHFATNNYIINGNDVIIIQLVLVDCKEVKLQGEKVNLLNTLTYGQRLSELKFGDNTFIDSDTGEKVPGTLAWSTPDAILNVGTHEAEWKFTPTDAKTYMECTGKVIITVNKAAPNVISAPVPGSYTYSPLAISDDILNAKAQTPGIVYDNNGNEVAGTWSWVESNLIPDAGQSTHEVLFTPASDSYNTIKSMVTLTVKKAAPYIQTPPYVNKEFVHGDFLENKDLQPGVVTAGENGPVIEGDFSWVYAGDKLSYTENENGKRYEYLFWPKDIKNYELKYGSISLVVNRADNPPGMPGNLNVKNSCKTLRDVKLPTGWEFVQGQVDLDAELDIEKPISAEIIYLGADKDNYINTKATITITRSVCNHEKTERRGVIKATCIAEGSTGERWCLICGDKLEDGTTTPKDPENHTALTSKVIKQPTTSEEGVMEYICSGCGYTATESIAKIASSSGSDDDDDDDPAPASTPAPTATSVPAVTPVRPDSIPVKPAVKEEPTIPVPFLRGENGREGWDVITEAVTEAAEGDTVIVDMNGSSVVPGDVFDRIRGRDITVEFDLGNGILWKVNGQSVEKGNIGDIDFTVRTGEDANDTIPVEIINALTGERMFMNLSLAYEGEFGFEAVLSLNVGAANAGLYANLFYYNESTKELEYLCAGEIGQDGGAELTFTHASEYTIVIDEQPMEETEQTQEVISETGGKDNQEEDNTVAPNVENTGHTGPLIFCIILIMAALIVIGIIVFVKKNKKEE